MILLDSNVVIDVLERDGDWYSHSLEALAEHGSHHRLAINPIVYAEVSVGFARVEELDAALDGFARLDLPWPAAFLAGKAFVAYRRRGGRRRSPLPDFYIGAHAAVAGLPLLTRDPQRYRTYFPRLELIAP